VTDPDEAQLLTRARGGDEQAFGQLVELHSEPVYRALRRFGLDADEAGDVAQEVFLRAWRGLDRFEGRAQLSTWLYRIAFNEAQRRLGRRPIPTARTRSPRSPTAPGTDLTPGRWNASLAQPLTRHCRSSRPTSGPR
jgi:DNA-directed RNA polymerase specialized sigma24 family protein